MLQRCTMVNRIHSTQKPASFTWSPATVSAMQPGATTTIVITLPTSYAEDVQGFTSGMTLEIMLHTTGGKDYPKVITLP